MNRSATDRPLIVDVPTQTAPDRQTHQERTGSAALNIKGVQPW